MRLYSLIPGMRYQTCSSIYQAPFSIYHKILNIYQALLRATTTRIPARNGKQELFSAPYVKVCDRFGKNAAAWALLGKQKDTYNLLFLAEFGFAFEALFEQLVDHGAVDAGIIQKEYGLTNQELRMLEKFVAKSC